MPPSRPVDAGLYVLAFLGLLPFLATRRFLAFVRFLASPDASTPVPAVAAGVAVPGPVPRRLTRTRVAPSEPWRGTAQAVRRTEGRQSVKGQSRIASAPSAALATARYCPLSARASSEPLQPGPATLKGVRPALVPRALASR